MAPALEMDKEAVVTAATAEKAMAVALDQRVEAEAEEVAAGVEDDRAFGLGAGVSMREVGAAAAAAVAAAMVMVTLATLSIQQVLQCQRKRASRNGGSTKQLSPLARRYETPVLRGGLRR